MAAHVFKLEQRIVTGTVEHRSADTGTSTIAGYGAIYNSEAVIAGEWRERIMPGAFDEALGHGSDVRSLYNHDKNRVLGRRSAGTLRLSSDERGLKYEVDINKADPEAVGVAARVARGDVSGSSFVFRVAPGGQKWETRSGELPLRTISKLAEVLDIGPVAFPAYEDSTAEARATAKEIVSQGLADLMATDAAIEPRADMTADQGEEAAELVQYSTAAAALAQAKAALATAAGIVAGLIAAETESPTTTADAEAAEEEVETAQLRSLLVLCGQICGAVSGVSALAQAMLSDEYDPILYARSADADRDRVRLLQLAQARCA